MITRTGWSAVPGFEVNLLDGSRGGELWDAIMEAGGRVRHPPDRAERGAPRRGRHLQLGLGYQLKDTPFHVMGLERLVEEQPQDYIGKSALERIRAEGVDRKLVGIEFDDSEPLPGITRSWAASSDGRPVGPVTDAVWSPGLEKNIGYVWMPIELSEPGTAVDVDSEHGPMTGRTAGIPFVDPRKERPAKPLEQVGLAPLPPALRLRLLRLPF